MSPYPVGIRTAAFVPRWSIIWNSIPDNVAQHSYYVALYSYMIANDIGWLGPRDVLMFNALMHDADEVITGDIVGPVKSRIVDDEAKGILIEEHIEDKLGELPFAWDDLWGAHSRWMKDVEHITAAADKMDALFYLIVNKRLGNKVLDDLIVKAQNALEGAWYSMPASKDKLAEKWITVLHAIMEHNTKGGDGI